MSNVVEIKKNGASILVLLRGALDEETTLNSSQLQGSSEIIFDFKELQSINSCGIREWINWIKPVSNTKITFKHCPKVIVDQINMIDGFLPQNAIVESFYVPYYSDETGEEKLVLFSFGREYSHQGLKLPDGIKDSKGNSMEIDVIEGKYFRFLNRNSSAA